MREDDPTPSRNDDAPDGVDSGGDTASLGGLNRTLEGESAPGTLRSGQKIGPCTLRRLIGTGGMGAVYEAVQESPRRTVAVKLMRRGITSKSALRRFEFESQILARLRHPAIAQVYEAGTHQEDGEDTPWFVMEYIPGAMSITDYARRHDLDVRDRMKLFLQVCDAVQHGHLKGIVHRDLKPGNILIASNGKPKIIDFGVARSTDSDLALTTLQTDIGQMLGTVQYMSPEQCEADPNDIDPRSDVYALGVVLHELLTGDVPYDVRNAALHEAVRIVRETQPTKLSSIDRRLRGDLETIAGKALEKERRRRYQSASALSEDIGHWLDDEPINAQAPGALDLLTRLARRHTAATLSIAGVFVALVAAVTVMALSTAEVARQREAALAAQAQELQQRDAAEAVKEFLKSIISDIDPERVGDLDKTLMVRTLDQATDRIENEFAGQPLLQAELRVTLGDTWRGLGLYSRAVDEFEQAAAIRIAAVGEHHLDTLKVQGRLGRVLREEGKHEEAIAILQDQIDALQAHVEPSHPDVLQSKGTLSMALIDLVRLDEAEQLLGDVVAAWRRKDSPTQTSIAALVALGDLQLRRDNFDGARETLSRALSDLDRFETDQPTLRMNVLYKLAITSALQGDLDRAVPLLRQSLEQSEATFGPDHPKTLTTAGSLGGVLANSGDLAGAEPLFRRVYEGQLRSLGPEHPNTLITQGNVGNLQYELGQLDMARATAETALTISLNVRGPDHPHTHGLQRLLASVLLEQESPEQALPLSNAVLEGAVKVFGEQSRQTKAALDLLIETQEALGDTEAADAARARLADIED